MELVLTGTDDEIAQLATNLEHVLAEAGHPVPSGWRSTDTAEDIANMIGWWVEVGSGVAPEYAQPGEAQPSTPVTQENPTRAVEIPELEIVGDGDEGDTDEDELDLGDEDEDDEDTAPPPKPRKKKAPSPEPEDDFEEDEDEDEEPAPKPKKTKKSKKKGKKKRKSRVIDEDED